MTPDPDDDLDLLLDDDPADNTPEPTPGEPANSGESAASWLMARGYSQEDVNLIMAGLADVVVDDPAPAPAAVDDNYGYESFDVSILTTADFATLCEGVAGNNSFGLDDLTRRYPALKALL